MSDEKKKNIPSSKSSNLDPKIGEVVACYYYWLYFFTRRKCTGTEHRLTFFGERASVAQAGLLFFITIQIDIGNFYKYNIKSFYDQHVLYL